MKGLADQDKEQVKAVVENIYHKLLLQKFLFAAQEISEPHIYASQLRSTTKKYFTEDTTKSFFLWSIV